MQYVFQFRTLFLHIHYRHNDMKLHETDILRFANFDHYSVALMALSRYFLSFLLLLCFVRFF